VISSPCSPIKTTPPGEIVFIAPDTGHMKKKVPTMRNMHNLIIPLFISTSFLLRYLKLTRI
jgi:hypothetical protein